MKKQINSVSNWSVKSIITVTILSAMLCTFGANANNKPAVANAVTMKVESENTTESLMNSMAERTNEYKAADFVQADLVSEIGLWMNENPENSDILIDAGQYKAAEFVKADMTFEVENWMNNRCL